MIFYTCRRKEQNLRYNLLVIKPRNLPDANRLSVLAATILLAYTLTHYVHLPARDYSLQLPGILLTISININTAVTFLVAGLTASGADWLLRDHPASKGKSTLEHWLLPALTAWVIGIPLSQLPLGITWWAVFAIGGVLLMLVLVAEYIVVDPDDVRHSLAAAGLTAVSFALYLAAAILLRSTGGRLYILMPALMLAGGLVSLRTLHLRLHGQWKLSEAMVIALVVGQLTAAFHYWPLSPSAFGLAVLAPAYALTALVARLSEGEPISQAIVEPGITLLIIWGAAVWLR